MHVISLKDSGSHNRLLTDCTLRYADDSRCAFLHCRHALAIDPDGCRIHGHSFEDNFNAAGRRSISELPFSRIHHDLQFLSFQRLLNEGCRVVGVVGLTHAVVLIEAETAGSDSRNDEQTQTVVGLLKVLNAFSGKRNY